MGEVRASFPRFRREGDAPRVELTEDDVAILRHVHRHRFIRADDLYRLFPERSADRLSRRLTLLYRAGYLDRPLAQIDRFRPGGSQSLVYGLDNVGARYLTERAGVSIKASDWRARNRSFTRESLDHTLAIAQFMVRLNVSCRHRPGAFLLSFEDILKFAPDSTRQSMNPKCWSVPIQWSSGRVEINVIPDAIFGLQIRRQNEKALQSFFFLEIDRGTTTIVPAERIRDSASFLYRTSILRKFLSYAESFRQGLHKLHLNIISARVLILTTSDARASAMRKAAYNLVVRPFRLPTELFLFGSQANTTDPLGISYTDTLGRHFTLIPTHKPPECLSPLRRT